MLDENIYAGFDEDSEYYRLEVFGEDNPSFPRSHGMIADSGPEWAEDGVIRNDLQGSASWLIDKNLAHIQNGRLVPDSLTPGGLLRGLSALPHRKGGSYKFIV